MILAAHLAGCQHSEFIARKVSDVGSVELEGRRDILSAGNHRRKVHDYNLTFMTTRAGGLLPLCTVLFVQCKAGVATMTFRRRLISRLPFHRGVIEAIREVT